MQAITEKETAASVVKVFPKASDIFKERRINFCCDGDRPLEEVFLEGELDSEEVLTELNDAYQEWKKKDHEVVDWNSLGPAKLVDHIMEKHHGYLKEELNPLGELVTRVYSVHGGRDEHLQDLYRLYHQFKIEIEEHMNTEENDVFPLIKANEMEPSEKLKQQIRDANSDLEKERAVCSEVLKHIREITNGFEPPVNACGSYRIAYARLAELETETLQYVHLENNILFKQF